MKHKIEVNRNARSGYGKSEEGFFRETTGCLYNGRYDYYCTETDRFFKPNSRNWQLRITSWERDDGEIFASGELKADPVYMEASTLYKYQTSIKHPYRVDVIETALIEPNTNKLQLIA